MKLNQYQIQTLPVSPAFDPWKDIDFSGILNDLYRGVAIAFDPMLLPTNVIFNNPATIVFWNDGTKTVVKCQPGDVFSAETGLTTAMLKKYMGNDNTFNRIINKWLKRTGQYHPAPPALLAPDYVDTPDDKSME